MTDVAADLRAALPANVVVTDVGRLQSYRNDRAMFCPAGTPAAVVLARETAHVQQAMRVAAVRGVPVVQGALTGLSGVTTVDDLAAKGCRWRL